MGVIQTFKSMFRNTVTVGLIYYFVHAQLAVYFDDLIYPSIASLEICLFVYNNLKILSFKYA